MVHPSTSRGTHKTCVYPTTIGGKHTGDVRSQYKPPKLVSHPIKKKNTMNVSPLSSAPLAPCLRVAPLTPGKKRRESLTISLHKEYEDDHEYAPVRIRHILRKSHSYDDAPQIPSRGGSPTTAHRPVTNRKHSLCSMTESRWSDSYLVALDETPQRKFSLLSRESSTPVTPGTPRKSFTKPSRIPSSVFPEIVHVPVVISDEDDLSDIEQ